jgi:hypothetical protein
LTFKRFRLGNAGKKKFGAASTSPYSIRLLRMLVKHGLHNEDPKAMAVP